MATKVEVIEHVTCDEHLKHGEEKPATERRDFANGKKHYTLDLCSADARKFDRMMQTVIEVAQPVRQGNRRRGGRGAQASNDQIRAWAASRGIKVSPKGRIASSVVDQFNAANG